MSLRVPPAVNYPSGWGAMPAFTNRKAPEGEKQASFQVDWATMGGVDNSVFFNLQNQSTAPLSQICALSVDNSDCGMDVRFVFPDTGTTVTIPAGAPNLITPVFTNQLQFYLVATVNGEIEEPLDTTRFTLLNFVPPPLAIPNTTAQEGAGQGFINADATASTVLVAAANSGSIEGIQVFYSGTATGTGLIQGKIQDGTARDLCWFEINVKSGDVYNIPLISLNGVNLRYSGGLFLLQSGTNIGGQFITNLLAKVP